MSSSRRRGVGDINPKLHMDRQPIVTRINDPSLPAGKRREIDNVMKKARATANGYWDRKLLEVEEKDPNRWRHTGYKKMYIEGETSSGESDREHISRDHRGYNAGSGGVGSASSCLNSNRYGRSRSPRVRKSPPLSPPGHREMIDNMSRGRMSPISSSRGGGGGGRVPRSPERGLPRSPNEMGARRPISGRPRSPLPESALRRVKSRSPMGGRRRASPPPMSMSSGSNNRRRTPPPPPVVSNMGPKQRSHILPRSKRPPSPPPRNTCRSRSNSSVSSCSDESCSECSSKNRYRSQSVSVSRSRGGGPRSPPPKASARGPPYPRVPVPSAPMHNRPSSPPRGVDKYHRAEMRKMRRVSCERNLDVCNMAEGHVKVTRPNRHSPPEDPRLKNRPPEPPEPTSSNTIATPSKKKKKIKELRTRIKVEGEKRKKHSSSDSEDSGGSDSDEAQLPSFTATTRLTLSERFAKMAQWSIDRSNMENMRITKDSAGGALKVMIEEGIETPPRRFSYSPAPAGHFPEELATTAPSGMLSWDDVRVRYEYYKSRGYLRDLDLKDYIKWEEWWYKYQEWLKHERYYEYWERQQIARRRRKKIPISQRLN